MTEMLDYIIEEQENGQVDDVEYVEIKDPYGFIYITTNHIDGKRYIGQKVFNGNWRTYLGSGKHIKEAIKKYGRENFSKVIVAIAYSKDELNTMEQSIIAEFNADKSRDYYNIDDGGYIKGKSGEDAYWYGKKIPRDMIERANLKRHKIVYQFTLKGEYIAEYKSVTEAAKLNNVSKQNISKSCLFPQYSAAGSLWSYNRDIGDRVYDETKNHLANAILQYSYDGIMLINEFSSAKNASSKTGINISNIFACCNGKRKHAGGFVWKWK